MQFTGLGGTDEVGASSYLYTLPEGRLLVDAGVRPGLIGSSALPDFAPLEDGAPDAILITHAHLDHIGALPLVSNQYPRAPLYMTAPTARLLLEGLSDSLKIGQSQGQPLFNARMMKTCLERVRVIGVGQRLTLEGGRGSFVLELREAGHLLGAVSALIHSPASRGGAGATVYHSGDFSNIAGSTTPPAYKPPTPLAVDAVISESTYGDTNLPSRKEQIRAFVAGLRSTLEGGGKVLIPTFALGRAQEVIAVLLSHMAGGQLPAVPIYLDGLVRAMTRTYEELLEHLPAALQNQARISGQSPFLRPPTVEVQTDAQRQRIVSSGEACVILASSGMLHAGRSPYYARALLPDPRNALYIVGYQDAESPGRRLLDLSRGGEVELPTPGGDRETVSVAAEVTRYYLSAHADRGGIIGQLSSYPSPRVLWTHGEWNARSALNEHFGSKLESRLPRAGETVDLLAPARVRATASFTLPGKTRRAELEAATTSLPLDEVSLERPDPGSLRLEEMSENLLETPSSSFEARVRFGVGDVPGIYDPERKTFTLYLEDLRDPDLFISGTYHLEAKRGNSLQVRLKQRHAPVSGKPSREPVETPARAEPNLPSPTLSTLEQRLERGEVPEKFQLQRPVLDPES